LSILPTIAYSESTVLITGESGTGKELIARAIHKLSDRVKHPFVAINCGGFPETLIESELFGYETGAFTGAIKNKPGRFALAKGGTLFLDEVGDLSLSVQAKLLRVLQEKNYEPLGGVKTVETDVRILAATHRNLTAMVADKLFREDLYYRINVIELKVPPLRERMEDLPLLVNHFIRGLADLNNKDVTSISPNAMKVLMAYDYPGNIRELQNIIEHGFVLSPGGLIRLSHLPDKLKPIKRSVTTSASLLDFEKQCLLKALENNNGDRQAAAQELGIHKTTLYRKLHRLDIELPRQNRRSSEK